MPSRRVRAERDRLMRVAANAGLDADALMAHAEANATRARAEGAPLDRQTSLVQMRRLLDAAGIDHWAWDGFGTDAPKEHTA